MKTTAIFLTVEVVTRQSADPECLAKIVCIREDSERKVMVEAWSE